jgi:hypothetical protein
LLFRGMISGVRAKERYRNRMISVVQITKRVNRCNNVYSYRDVKIKKKWTYYLNRSNMRRTDHLVGMCIRKQQFCKLRGKYADSIKVDIKEIDS